MALLDLFGKGTVSAIGKVADDLFTSDEERLNAENEHYRDETNRIKVEQSDRQAQIDVNLQEAKHRSLFVAGWRPALGWTCTFAVAYHFILHDMIAWAISIWAPDTQAPPDLDISELIFLLTGMLGLTANRTIEKIKGCAHNNMKSTTQPPIATATKIVETFKPTLKILK